MLFVVVCFFGCFTVVLVVGVLICFMFVFSWLVDFCCYVGCIL